MWTGEEMIVWGGSDYRKDLDDGAAYDAGRHRFLELSYRYTIGEPRGDYGRAKDASYEHSGD